MAEVTRGQSDETVTALRQALEKYEQAHSGASAELFRRNPGSIHIRIVDAGFEAMSRSQRHDDVWEFLTNKVGDDVMSEVALLLLLAPAELNTSLANFEFENPRTTTI